MVLKVYLAGRYSLLKELKEESKKFEAAGIEITSRWLDNKEDGLSFKDVAMLDIEDVDKADAVVLFSEPYGTMVSGGGRHVEFGYAMGRGKKLVVVGPLENIFHWHPDVNIFPKTEYAIRYLTNG